MDDCLQRSLSVLDRLLLTHSIWLQLSINPDSALCILQREIAGTFLVCKCAVTQRKVLCVRVQESNVCVAQYPIREEDSTFSLESSALSFPDLCRLVAFTALAGMYCLSHLSFLKLSHRPPTTHSWRASHTLAWSSGVLRPPWPPNGPPTMSVTWSSRPRSPCFINPLFLQPSQPSREASHKRHRLKRSLRVRVSTESSFSLTPGDSEWTQGDSDVLRSNERMARRAGGLSMLRRTAALVPTSEEEDEQMLGEVPPTSAPLPEKAELKDLPQDEELCLALERRHAPSLAELDSNSSFSSLEEEESQLDSALQWPPLTCGTRFPVANPASTLRRMSAAFVCVFAPERRVARLVEELSRDRRSAFGSLIQDFLIKQKEELKVPSWSSAVELLQGLRRFLSQAKSLLLEAGELEPPIETLVPENEKELALEKAVFGCVLKPLKVQLGQMLLTLHTQDGTLQRFTNSLQACQEGALQRLGVRVAVLDAQGVERAKKKLNLMQRSHSPIDKVLLLLQVCKSVYKAMGAQSEQEFSSEDFLPALSYVVVQCNIPQLLLETEYMMEMLESSWLSGEGGYYLTSIYASLCLIQSQPGTPCSGGLTNEAQENLREWSKRRSQEAKLHKESQQNQRFVRILFQNTECCAARTLQWKAGESVEVLTRTCAEVFAINEPQHYCLFWRNAGEMHPVPLHTQPHELGAPTLSYLRKDHDFSKMRRLTRGGAVDLEESACEE